VSRRQALDHRWNIGDPCQVPTYLRIQSSGRSVTRWTNGEVVSVRGDRVVVSRYGWESEHPAWELREPPRHVGRAIARIVNRFGHDRHRRTA
jgi:hypothetical protein